jgi:PAS domain S-box-containing protein
MNDEDKTKEQLINELVEMRQWIAELEEAETKRKQAEEALRESQQLLERTFTSLREAVFIIDADTVEIVDCNPAALEIFGYSRQEMLGRTTDFLHVDEAALEEFRKHLYPAIEEKGLPSHLEFRMKRKDGTVFPTEHSVMPLEDEQGKRMGWLSVVRDITERKRAEEALRESEEKFRTIFESVPISMIVIDKDGIMVEVSPHQVVHTARGLTPREGYIGKSLITHPTIVNAGLSDTYRQLLKGESFDLKDVHFPSVQRGAEGYYFNIKGVPLFKESEVIGAITVHEEITERKRAEETLRESEQRLKEAQAMGRIGNWEFDMDSQTIEWSDQVFELYERDSALGPPTPEEEASYYTPEQAEILWEYAQRAIETGEELEYDLQAKLPSGRIAYFWASMRPIKDKSGRVVRLFGTVQDITERTRAEQALRASERRFRALTENSADGIALLDAKGAIRYASPTSAQALGYSVGELVGTNMFELMHPDDIQSVSLLLSALVEKPETPLTIQFRFRHKDGSWCWLEATGNNLLAEPAVQAIVVNYRDITERKRAEEALKEYSERLEEMVAERTAELREVNAQLAARSLELRDINAELEAFAYSVSHDLRAPLRAINGFAQIIARRHQASLNEEGQHYFDNILQASVHMGHLIDDLLRYSRLGRQAVRRQPVSLGDVLAQVADSLAGRVAETGAHLSLPDNLPILHGDQMLLGQIFTNLLDNALTYHCPGVPPQVVVSCQAEADTIILSVADNGIGIPPEFHEKIFNIFQRLHSQDEYPGTGVGLAIVKKAVGLLGGRVWVESVVGEGSTFYVELPVGGNQ